MREEQILRNQATALTVAKLYLNLAGLLLLAVAASEVQYVKDSQADCVLSGPSLWFNCGFLNFTLTLIFIFFGDFGELVHRRKLKGKSYDKQVIALLHVSQIALCFNLQGTGMEACVHN